MYDRVVDDQELLDPAAPGTSRFLQLVAPVNPKGMAHWEIGHVLAKKGLDWSATESLMKEVSWEGVRHAPLRFVGFSFHQAWNELFADPTGYILWWAVPDEYSKELETVPALGVRESSLKWRGIVDSQFRAMWNVIPWLALASLLSLPFMQDKLVFLGVAILSFFYLLSTAFVEYFLPRYNLAIIPFVFLMAIGLFTGIPKLAYEIRRAVRRRWIHPEERRSTARIYR